MNHLAAGGGGGGQNNKGGGCCSLRRGTTGGGGGLLFFQEGGNNKGGLLFSQERGEQQEGGGVVVLSGRGGNNKGGVVVPIRSGEQQGGGCCSVKKGGTTRGCCSPKWRTTTPPPLYRRGMRPLKGGGFVENSRHRRNVSNHSVTVERHNSAVAEDTAADSVLLVASKVNLERRSLIPTAPKQSTAALADTVCTLHRRGRAEARQPTGLLGQLRSPQQRFSVASLLQSHHRRRRGISRTQHFKEAVLGEAGHIDSEQRHRFNRRRTGVGTPKQWVKGKPPRRRA